MQIDGRALDHQSLETIRRMAVKRVREGESPSAVIKSYGLNRTTIYKWLAKARGPGGERNLSARKASGRKRHLTPRQASQVRRWMCGKDPRQYGFDYGLWTRQIVCALVSQRFGITISVASAGRLLARLGITPQKPLRRAYERDPEAIAKWQRETYPALKVRSKRRGGEIFFLDEAGFRSDDPLGRAWGVRGQTPVVQTSGQRQSINAISAISPRGAFWFMTYTGRLNAQTFIQFLKTFRRGRRGPVMLVVDKHPAHIAKSVAQYLQPTRGGLELHFLPGYAPDLNPDEFVWQHIKRQGTSKKPLLRNESLQTRVHHDLSTLKTRPSMLRSFFCAPSVSYTMN